MSANKKLSQILYIYSTTIVTKEDLKSEISNIIKNIFAEITNKNILRFQQKLTRALLVIHNKKIPPQKVLNFIQKNKLRNLYVNRLSTKKSTCFTGRKHPKACG